MTLSTISYNVYDTEKDCVTAEGNFQKDEYESNEILDNSYFTRKTRSMAMLEGMVSTLMCRPCSAEGTAQNGVFKYSKV